MLIVPDVTVTTRPSSMTTVTLFSDDRGLAERLAQLSELDDDDRDAFLRVLDAFLTRKRLRVLAGDAH